MNPTPIRLLLSAVCALALGLTACAVDSEELGEGAADGELADGSAADVDGKADHVGITFSAFTDVVGDRGNVETRRTFTSARQYRDYFGHAAPADVRWGDGDWVVFYSAGIQPTGGYSASIERISRSGNRLTVVTRLESPGRGCAVTEALTKPHVLVRLSGWRTNPTRRYLRDDVVRDCEPAGPFCGGIAGFPCPGAGECGDDPTDDCDPAHGGADCGGVCSCTALGLCVAGQRWDASPEVCACVPEVDDPCARVRCPGGTMCVSSGGSAECVPTLTCATVLCAPGTYCEESPSGPRCVASPTVTCASLRCRQGYECVDAPSGATCERTPGGCTMDSDCVLYDQYCSSNPCACEVLGYNQRPATCAPGDQVACFRQPCGGRTAVCNGGRCEVL